MALGAPSRVLTEHPPTPQDLANTSRVLRPPGGQVTIPNSPGRAQLGCDHGGPDVTLVSLSRLLKQKQIFLARHRNEEGS